MLAVGWQGQEGVCNSDAAYLRGVPHATQWSHGLAVPSALTSSSAEGKNNTKSVTSGKGHACFAATGRSVAVPDGNKAEFLREKAVLKRSAGVLDCGVALLMVVVNPTKWIKWCLLAPSLCSRSEMSNGFILFSCFKPHFTSPFTSPFSGALRAVKELWAWGAASCWLSCDI